jgi:hypothetical protein
MAFAFISLGTSDVVKSLWNPTHGLTVTKCVCKSRFLVQTVQKYVGFVSVHQTRPDTLSCLRLFTLVSH